MKNSQIHLFPPVLLVPEMPCARYRERNKLERTDVLDLFISQAFLITSDNLCSAGLQKALNALCSVKGAPFQGWLNPHLGVLGAGGQ